MAFLNVDRDDNTLRSSIDVRSIDPTNHRQAPQFVDIVLQAIRIKITTGSGANVSRQVMGWDQLIAFKDYVANDLRFVDRRSLFWMILVRTL